MDRRVIAEFRARGGVVGGPFSGLSMLLLHHVGAKSGTERVTPLAYWLVGKNRLAVLASNFGAPRNPAWFRNLVVNPVATVEIGTSTWTARARVAHAEERVELLRGILARSPAVVSAVDRSPREIPVVVLELDTAA